MLTGKNILITGISSGIGRSITELCIAENAFVITEVPRQIKNLYQISGYTKDDIDYFILHQANKFMNEHLLKKMKIEPAKAPMNLNKYGNTSSVSIPLTIVSELQEKIQGKKQKILLSGFGVGLSLASAILDIDKIHICKLTEL